jgi:DNA-binding transcriptional ArsR family regulator
MSLRSARATTLENAAPVFAALGDGIRLQLVSRLCKGGPSSIAELASGFDVTRQAITKHLHVLSEAGLVRDRKIGRERIFELEAERLELAKRCLDEISTKWDEALERLRRLVEE